MFELTVIVTGGAMMGASLCLEVVWETKPLVQADRRGGRLSEAEWESASLRSEPIERNSAAEMGVVRIDIFCDTYISC